MRRVRNPARWRRADRGLRLVMVGRANSFQRRLAGLVHEKLGRSSEASIAAVTGVGTGKTTGAGVLSVSHLLSCPPGSRFLVVAPTYGTWSDPMLPAIQRALCMMQPEDLALPEQRRRLVEALGPEEGGRRWRELVSPHWIRPDDWLDHPLLAGFNKTDKRIELRAHDGPRTLYGRSADRPGGYDGMTDLCGSWAEELRHWPADGEGWRILNTRVRMSAELEALGVPTLRLATTTPQAGHWIEATFKDEGRAAEQGWAVLHGTMRDNELMGAQSRERMRKSIPAGAAAKRLIEGLWTALEGTVWAEVIGDESYVQVRPREDLPTVIGYDFGTFPAASIMQPWPDGGDDAWVIVDELDNEGVPTTRAAARRLRLHVDRLGLTGGLIYYDPAGQAETSKSAQTEVAILREEMGPTWICKAITNPRITGRRVGTEYVMAGFCDADGVRRLFLSQHLRGKVRDLSQGAPATLYQSLSMQEWGPDGKPRKGQRSGGVSVDFSHQTDALRYGYVGATWRRRSVADVAQSAQSVPRHGAGRSFAGVTVGRGAGRWFG